MTSVEDDDLIAAEYVLGVLATDERQSVQRRIVGEQAFANLVENWEMRLSALDVGYNEVEAPSAVKHAIDRRLFGAAVRIKIWTSLAFWRGCAVAAVAALMVFIAVPFYNPPSAPSPSRLVASLTADGSDVKYLVVYDGLRHEVSLSHVSGERVSGKDFELWMIEDNNLPVSMGIIPQGANTHISVSPAAQEKIAQGAVLAVSLEQAGGSTTGQPMGPVVAAGDLKTI